LKFSFRDAQGRPLSSTEFAKQLLSSAVESANPGLARDILDESNWRKNYQRYFLQLSEIEFAAPKHAIDFMQSALAALTGQIKNENNISIFELARDGFAASALVETVEISGNSAAEPHWPNSSASLETVAADWVKRGLAESDVQSAFRFLDQNPKLTPGADLLFALAGNAELSGAKDWLSLGGRVAVVARPNPAAWQSLIDHAQQSAGTLLVPVLRSRDSVGEVASRAGLDLVQDVSAIASWLHELSRNESRLVVSSYAYIGGSNQIVAQAAQDSIIAVASTNIVKSKLALSWLATPLDVVVGSRSIFDEQLARHESRSFLTRLRDSIWRVFGQLTKPSPSLITTANGQAASFDASSVRQGSSYLLAKHSEKWRAMVAARQGNLVSYTVAPPAATRSVLGVRVLNYTYKGLARFGVYPFSARATRRVMALLLLRNLNDPSSVAATANSANQLNLVSATSIHGGTWRMAYQPESIWVAATVLGFFSSKKASAIIDFDSALQSRDK
jgi:hypothetical protein